MSSNSALYVSLTPELAAYVRDRVGSGRYGDVNEVVRDALRLQQQTPDTQTAANHSFLLRLTDRLNPIRNPRRVMAEAAFLLGSHLEADRTGYAEIDADGQHFSVAEDWVAGDMPSLAGHYRLRDFGPRLVATLRKGVTVRFADAATDPLVQETEGVAATFAAVHNRAAVSVPLVKDGVLHAVLYVHQRETRNWTDADEALIREVAERTWAAVERARAESALRDSEARFRAIFDASIQFMGLLSPDGIILEANRAALEFGGLTPDAIVGRPLWDLDWWTKAPDPDAPAQLRNAIAQAAAGLAVRYDAEVRAGDGRVATVDFSVRPVRDGVGSIAFLMPEGRDITEGKQAVVRLAESEERFRTLADAMPQMVWVSDADGNTIYSNARMVEFTGLLRGIKGPDWTDIVHPDDRAASLELRRQTLITGKPFEREHRLQRFDGVYRWMLARALPVWDSAGRIKTWYGTSTDITEIVEARQVLAQSHDELEHLVAERTRALQDAAHELAAEMTRREEMQSTVLQAQKLEALGQLTSGVAHDFNNVLAAITASYGLIRRRAPTPEVIEVVEHGERAVERATKLIGQLLTFVRRERLTPKLLQIGKLLIGAEDLIGHAVGDGVKCSFEVAANLHPVLADPYQLEVALLNLAVNARDAMGGRGTMTIGASNISAGDRPAALAPGDYVAVAVRDTGKGMPPEIVARATEAFFTTKPAGEGTGLGLAMVQGVASRSGGCLHIDSRPGIGTVVEIILPRAPIEALVAGEQQTGTPDPTLHGDATLLLVDDDEQFRPVTAAFLRELGYTVLEADNAETATALVHTLPRLDLVMTDHEMPGASGLMMVTRLRRDWPGLPVQFLTGKAPGAELAGEAVLQKPFSFTALGNAVLERLGRWTPQGSQTDRLLKRLRAPALRQLYLTWQASKADGVLLPPLRRIEPLPFGLGPHAYTVAVEGGAPPTFRYVSVGHALNMRLGRPLQGSVVEDAPAEDEEILGELQACYRRCARNLGPVFQSARFNFGDGSPLQFERLVLPMSENGQTVTHLVGIVLFSEPGVQAAGGQKADL